jgi:hypothetical protein
MVGIVVLVLVYFGAPAVGVDRIIAGAGLLAAALLFFLVKFLTIPARFHHERLDAGEIRKFAVALEHQHGLGESLRLEGGARGRPADDELSWPKRCRLWFRETDRILREYDDSEAFMFRTLEAESGKPPISFWDKKAIEAEKLVNRLNKLRLIIGRAYERAGKLPASR